MLPSEAIIALSLPKKYQKIKIPKDPKKDQRLGVSEAMVAVEELSGVWFCEFGNIYIYISFTTDLELSAGKVTKSVYRIEPYTTLPYPYHVAKFP